MLAEKNRCVYIVHCNIWFGVLNFMLQSTTVVCRTVVMHQAGIGGGFEVFVAGEQ